MPNLNHCHECEKPFTPTYSEDNDGNLIAICDNCIEPTTADEYNVPSVSEEDYDFIADENKNMSLFLENLGYDKPQIDEICVGNFDV